MALPNPYSFLNPETINAGQEALDSGEVSPEQAMRNLSPILKFLGMGQNPLLNPKSVPAPTAAQKRMKEIRGMEAAPGFVGPPRPPQPEEAQMNTLSQPGVFQAVQPQEKGSGMTEQEKASEMVRKALEGNVQHNTAHTDVLTMSPEQLKQAYSNIEQIPEIQSQRKGITDLKDMLSMSGENGGDYVTGPLSGLLQSEFGRKVDAFKQGAGPTPEEQTKNILGNAEKIQKSSSDLSTRISDLIGKQKGGSVLDQLRESLTAKTADQVVQEALAKATDPEKAMRQVPIDTKLHWVQSAVDRDMKPIKESSEANQEAQRLLAAGTSINDTTFRDRFLKAAIGGRVTNYDLMRQSGDSSLAEQANQIIEKIVGGTFTPKNRAEYQNALEIMMEANQHEAQLRLARHKNIALNTYHLDEAMVDPMVSGFGVENVPAKTKAATRQKADTTINDKVPVYNSDGVPGFVPRSKLKDKLSKGYKLRSK